MPSFVPMDAFEQVKNSGKSSKNSANAEVVINSIDKGLRIKHQKEQSTSKLAIHKLNCLITKTKA